MCIRDRANIKPNAGQLVGKWNRALKHSVSFTSPSKTQRLSLLWFSNTQALDMSSFLTLWISISLSQISTPNWTDQKAPNLSISKSLKSPSRSNTGYSSEVRVFLVLICPFRCKFLIFFWGGLLLSIFLDRWWEKLEICISVAFTFTIYRNS